MTGVSQPTPATAVSSALDELLAGVQAQLDAKLVELREVRVLLDEARRLDDV